MLFVNDWMKFVEEYTYLGCGESISILNAQVWWGKGKRGNKSIE